MFKDAAGYEELTEKIIGCGIKVHEYFGPGLFESIYTRCFVIELRAAGLRVDVGRQVPLHYRGIDLDSSFEPDLIVEEVILIEVKAVERLVRVYHSQVLTYLKLTGCPVGLLMNFNVGYLKEGIRRLVRPDLYVKKTPA